MFVIVVVVALGCLVLLLGLAILGTMREVVLLRSEVTSLSELIVVPPEPSWLSTGYLPEALVAVHDQFAADEAQELILVYVESSCPSCRTIVSDLSAYSETVEITGNVLFVLIDTPTEQNPLPALLPDVEQTSCRFVVDRDKNLLAAAGIHGTPSALAITRTEAVGYKAGVTTQWILNRTSKLATA